MNVGLRKFRMPERLPRILVKAAGLILAVLSAMDVFLSLAEFEFAKISISGVFVLSMEVLCIVLGIFLYAGMAAMQGRSGWFLLLFFLNHLMLSIDALLWILEGDPGFADQHGRMMSSLYLYDIFTALIFIILTRQVTQGIYSVRELLGVRTKLDLAETIVAALSLGTALALWLLNPREGLLFSINENGVEVIGRWQWVFCILVTLPKAFCLIRIFRSKIEFSKKLPLLLYIALPFLFMVLGMSWEAADMSYTINFIVLLVTFGQFFSEIGAKNDKMKTMLGTYVSEDMVRHMLEDRDGQTGRNYTATVLLADLRGFTSTSGHLSTEDTVTILNHWLTEMTEVIRDLNGTVTEFLGDGFLVVFGAPTETDDHADRAVAAALKMQAKTEEASRWNRKHGYPSIRMGIGLSSGEILFGSFGTARVSRLMAIGKPVNRAFAAEEKTLGGQIFITPETKEMLHTAVEAGEIETIGGMELYSVNGIAEPWNLHFEVNEEPLKELEKPLRIRIRRLEGKTTEAGEFYGRLTAVSTRKAAILSEQPLKPFEQIRFNFSEVEETVYARNGSEASAPDGSCLVDITVCPRSFERYCD